MLVKVLKMHEKDEQTIELRFKDMNSNLWFVNLPKTRFGAALNIRAGEIIRIRDVNPDLNSRRNIVTCKETTNILKFLPTAKIVTHMQKEIPELSEQDKMLLEDASEVLGEPVDVTEIIIKDYINPEEEEPKKLKQAFPY